MADKYLISLETVEGIVAAIQGKYAEASSAITSSQILGSNFA